MGIVQIIMEVGEGSVTERRWSVAFMGLSRSQSMKGNPGAAAYNSGKQKLALNLTQVMRIS